jgi:hypothetical protein
MLFGCISLLSTIRCKKLFPVMILMSFYASMIAIVMITFFGCNMQIIGSTKCLQSVAGFYCGR